MSSADFRFVHVNCLQYFSVSCERWRHRYSVLHCLISCLNCLSRYDFLFFPIGNTWSTQGCHKYNIDTSSSNVVKGVAGIQKWYVEFVRLLGHNRTIVRRLGQVVRYSRGCKGHSRVEVTKICGTLCVERGSASTSVDGQEILLSVHPPIWIFVLDDFYRSAALYGPPQFMYLSAVELTKSARRTVGDTSPFVAWSFTMVYSRLEDSICQGRLICRNQSL